MYVKNNTIICVARASNSKRDCEHDLYCYLLPRYEALRAWRSRFPITTTYANIWFVFKASYEWNIPNNSETTCWTLALLYPV